MEENLVNIAISPNTLASLIKEGSIHLMDFKCLDKQAKQIVWGLFLAMLSNKIRMPRSTKMSENDKQEVLLLAIEYLKSQFNSQQNPCVALYIARYYRLLGSLKNISHYEQKKYVDHSTAWLTRHIHKPEHVLDIQIEIHNPEYVSESNVFVR